MHVHFVVNPAAGRRSSLPFAEQIASALGRAGHTSSRYVTRGPGDGAVHVAELAAEACDVLAVVGGDGTLGEVVNARPLPLPWPVAVVPMGTANLVARELRMPLGRDPAKTSAALASGAPWIVDAMGTRVGTEPPRIAVATIGVGADAEVVRTIEGLRAGAVGSGSYLRWLHPIWATLRGFRFPDMRIHLDERVTLAGRAVVVQNARNYGGVFRLSPDAALDSGSLQVMVVRGRTRRGLMRVVVGALLRRLHRDRGVRFRAADRIRVEAGAPVPVQADGDSAGTTDVHIERLAGALTLWRAAPPRRA